jgi:hypothetical protein
MLHREHEGTLCYAFTMLTLPPLVTRKLVHDALKSPLRELIKEGVDVPQ